MLVAWTTLLACRPPAPATPTDLAELSRGEIVEGFAVHALLTDGEDRPLGVRLDHQATGFTLTLLQLPTAPQGYLWVNTVPSGHRGEPHTQEHLLLGKGNVGRAVSTLEDLALVGSSAFTETLRTVYHFHTTAGPSVFFDVLEARLEALLRPDYTDEEIRREVHHYGVKTDPATGLLALEEKGTVYNEMDSSYQRPSHNLWHQMDADLYGPSHPLAQESGGLPDAIRTMTPAHIRAFHAATYQLANMGMITVLPEEVPLPVALAKLDEVLSAAQGEATRSEGPFPTARTLPPPEPVARGEVREVGYPHHDPSAPASLVLAYPPTRDLPYREWALLRVLLAGLAGPEHSNLYQALVDSQARERDLGAQGVAAWVSDEQGQPVYFSLSGMPSSGLTDDEVDWAAARIQQELADLAALPAGDPALEDLHRRLRAEVVQWRRWLRKLVSEPPQFGFRGTRSTWFDLLDRIERDQPADNAPFRQQLTHDADLAWVEAQLARTDNPWTEALERWGLRSGSPFVYVNRPEPALLEELAEARRARLAAKVAALRSEYGVDDDQAALARFGEAYDRATEELEAQQVAPTARFADEPPMTQDDTLDYEVREVAGAPALQARFASMMGAEVSVYLSLSALTPDEQPWLAVLPELLTDVGVVHGGVPAPYTAVIEQLQREVLAVSASIASNADTGRAELVLRGSGTDAAEVARAVEWAASFAGSPDWRPANLPRIRDVVDAELASLQRRVQGREEAWVNEPPAAWRHRTDPLQLHAWSFLTQAHDALRVYWRLADPGSGRGPDALAALATAGQVLDREGLRELLALLQGREAEVPLAANRFVAALEGLSESEGESLAKLGSHLERVLADIPDEALPDDWAYLCRRLAEDWRGLPEEALDALHALRRRLLARDQARWVLAGGPVLDGVEADLAPLAQLLGQARPPGATVGRQVLPAERVAARGGQASAVHVGLLDPTRRSGVHVHSAPFVSLSQTGADAVLDYLAAKAWSGGGAHALFMRTWGAGLAYSNGASASTRTGRIRYYAERCPSLGQTLDFVLDEIRAARVDRDIAEYAIAQAFGSRLASGYGSRARAMAADLVDGIHPDRVRAFRQAVLDQRARKGLPAALEERLPRVFGSVLPGLGEPSAAPAGLVSFVIGDDDQLQAWDAWLQASDGASLERLYPRDFWLTVPVD